MTADATWMKKITPSIFETLSLSDQGTLPLFPMEEFTNSLKGSLGLEDLSVQIQKMDFIAADAYYTGLGTKTIVIPLSMSPLSGEMYLVMGMEDIKTLIGCMEKTEDDKGSITLDNEAIIKGLYTYLLTEAIDSVMQLQVYKDLSIKITDGKNDSLQSYGIDLSISIHGAHLPARILVPDMFYKSIHSHFTFLSPTLENLESIPDVSIPISIRTGSVTLSREDLEGVVEGDFLIVRNSFYDVEKEKGSFQMLIGTSPLFQVKRQKDGIKVLDYLYFYNEENMDDIDDDSPLGDDFSSDFLSEDFEIPEDGALSPLDGIEAAGLPPIDGPEEEIKDEATVNQEMMMPEKTNLSAVPMTVHMEVARFSLSLEELKKLGPGFKLPVKINPLEVNLIVSGKSIGTGEVVEVGDTLGVKVTKLYS